METPQVWRLKLSFKNATILLTIVNVILLLHSFLNSPNRFSDPVKVDDIGSPLDLIKRVREIEQEAYAEEETIQPQPQQKPKSKSKLNSKETKQTDLSKRLKDLRSLNDASSFKALEEWRKRKMERARQRQLEKNGTLSLLSP